ncbi:hypothetical protein QQZ08_006470 [Neonectria magnoliae]|uniref:Cytochrome P450 n=1 Tax=Neonectria magnoliae TaxID=2732573 RepID=A0ABR1I0I5_9HYPO
MVALCPTLGSAFYSILPLTAEVSFLAGIVAHLAIRPIEIDSRAWTLFFSYLGVVTALLLTYAQACGFRFVEALFRTGLVSSAFNLGLISSILLYRAIFHRLHHFPGPFLAKLSRFYAMKNAINLKANEDIQRLHEQYGDFVRVGPREISINREAAIRAIYEPPTQCPRSTWYSQVSDDVTKITVNSTRDLALHKLRKRTWMKGLGFRVFSVYEDRIVFEVNLLISQIARHQGSSVDMTQYCMFFGFDVMRQVGFSKDFDMLSSVHKHPAIKGLHDNMTAVGVLGTVPWLMSMLSKIPGATGSYSRFTDWCGRELEAKRAAVNINKGVLKDQDPRDVISWLLRAEEDNDRSAPPGEGAFQEDSRLMIIAGRLYFLTKNPTTYCKLQKLVHAQFPGGDKEWTYEKAKAISFLDFIIYETLRLKPSVPAGLARFNTRGRHPN